MIRIHEGVEVTVSKVVSEDVLAYMDVHSVGRTGLRFFLIAMMTLVQTLQLGQSARVCMASRSVADSACTAGVSSSSKSSMTTAAGVVPMHDRRLMDMLAEWPCATPRGGAAQLVE